MAPDRWLQLRPSGRQVSGITSLQLSDSERWSAIAGSNIPIQPAAGRFDGENSNFGTVTIDDHIYKELTQTMMLLNGEAEDLHTEAAYAIA
jgi:hypothetical protein